MKNIIDYAGLYPPANLSLEEAFGNFVKYQNDPDSWMLARFVIPAKRLTELAPLMPADTSLAFTTLGRGGKNADEFFPNLELDIADINEFRSKFDSQVSVDAFEVAVPISELTESSKAISLVQKAADILSAAKLTPFFEAPFGDGWDERVELLISAVQKTGACFKLRTGGVTPDAFPSPKQMAWAIASVRDSGIFMKCTAGLHHPIRHYNESVQTKMYGFINVFGAGMLAGDQSLSQEKIQMILEDENASHFLFDDEGFSWKDLRIAISGIANARKKMISFGSCSFEEPREDLQKLNLL